MTWGEIKFQDNKSERHLGVRPRMGLMLLKGLNDSRSSSIGALGVRLRGRSTLVMEAKGTGRVDKARLGGDTEDLAVGLGLGLPGDGGASKREHKTRRVEH